MKKQNNTKPLLTSPLGRNCTPGSFPLGRIGWAFLLILIFQLSPFVGTEGGCQNIAINTTGAAGNSSALLDLNTGNNFASPNGKGLLVPNVSLASNTDGTTIVLPATSLLVYNTNATMTNGNGTGFYYNRGTPASPLWVVALTTGSGCSSAGNSSINSTSPADYCIETNERAAATWLNAATTCINAGGKLCTWSEWHAACSIGGTPALLNMTNNWEWVDGAVDPVGGLLGFGGCAFVTSAGHISFYAFRCCFAK